MKLGVRFLKVIQKVPVTKAMLEEEVSNLPAKHSRQSNSGQHKQSATHVFFFIISKFLLKRDAQSVNKDAAEALAVSQWGWY